MSVSKAPYRHARSAKSRGMAGRKDGHGGGRRHRGRPRGARPRRPANERREFFDMMRQRYESREASARLTIHDPTPGLRVGLKTTQTPAGGGKPPACAERIKRARRGVWACRIATYPARPPHETNSRAARRQMVPMSITIGVSAEDGRTALLTPPREPHTHIPRRRRDAANRIGAGEQYSVFTFFCDFND